MKKRLSVNCWNQQLFNELLKTDVDKIIVGIKDFSCRFNDYFTIEQLKEICDIKQNKKVSVCLNNIYHEHEIEALENLINELAGINIDEIIFHDFAIPQIIKEKNYSFNLNYNPETLNVNYGQVDFFKKNNFKAFTIARELTLKEVNEIANNKQGLETEIQVHGFAYFMHSNWKIISNYKTHLDLNDKTYNHNLNLYEIKEETRTLSNLIYEDKTGTHMFSGFVLSLVNEIPFLEGIDYLKIDPIFRSEEWTLKVVAIYCSLLNEEITTEQAFKKLSNLESKFKLSNSFAGNIKEMPHIEKGEIDNE